MRLNLSILKDHLPASYHTQLYGDQPRTLICPRPLLLDSDTILKNGRCYMVPSNHLSYIKPNPDCSLICIGGPIPYNWQHCGTPILQIMDVTDFASAFNRISQIYDDFDLWEEKMRDQLERQTDFDIRNILKLGIEMLDNYIIVTDHSLQVILSATSDSQRPGPMEIQVNNETHSLGPDMTESVKEVCSLERHIRVPYISAITKDGQRSYCKNLYPLGYFTGCVAISESTHSFRDSDFALADHFFSIFESAFEKHLQGVNNSGSPTESVLQKLLRDQPLTPEEQEMLTLEDQEAWYCFKLRENRSPSAMPKEYMHTALRTFIPQVVCSAIYHQQIVGLLKFSPQTNRADLFQSFREMLRRMNYSAGFSNPFQDLRSLNLNLIQADYSLTHGSDALNLFHHDILNFMLDECTSRMSAKHLTAESLQRVMDYDAQRGTEYLHTLDVYLKNEMSITHTAQDLFIHRSSLLKRLDKLTALLQDDLTDPKHRLYYRLWFALR